MKREELLKIREFTQEEINSKESIIKELEDKFHPDDGNVKNALGMILLHLLTLRQKEKVEYFALSTIDRIDKLEAENKKMREFINDIATNFRIQIIDNHTGEEDLCCKYCINEMYEDPVLEDHNQDCLAVRAHILLEEYENE